jgi:hypothetical protein
VEVTAYARYFDSGVVKFHAAGGIPQTTQFGGSNFVTILIELYSSPHSHFNTTVVREKSRKAFRALFLPTATIGNALT